VQERLRRRILRAFVGRGLLDCCEAKEMLGYTHSGFSVDASVCIEANDRAGLERLLRYCARPPFAMERLAKAGSALVYRCAKQPGNKAGELTLTPVALIARIAALVPPPRTHQHRYFGALAPNSPLRAAVVLMAASGEAEQALPVHPAQTAATAVGEGAAGTATFSGAQSLPAPSILPEPEPPKPSQAHYLWAVLIARIYEVFPLLCPICGGQMRILAFVTHRADIRHLLDHIGVASEPPHIAPARGPPLWEAWDAHMGEGSQGEPDWDRVEKPAPDYELDQRVNW
jgi:Putative transposase